MSWTHALCGACWTELNPDSPYREPVRMQTEERETEKCCRCGFDTRSGIYYRADPKTLRCEGRHE